MENTRSHVAPNRAPCVEAKPTKQQGERLEHKEPAILDTSAKMWLHLKPAVSDLERVTIERRCLEVATLTDDSVNRIRTTRCLSQSGTTSTWDFLKPLFRSHNAL